MKDDFEGKNTDLIVERTLESGERGGLIGRTIAGKYRIVQRLARGGMGIVYLAEHSELERMVVVKVLAHQLIDDEAAYSRFKREAKGLSQLSHPNIVTIFDYGQEGEVAYIVMEHIEGETLTQLLRRKGRLTYDEFLPVTMQILDALGAAHRREIVHRDIKPSNIMISKSDDRNDLVKVLDFGLARLHGTSVDITKGNLVGTVAYLAPEVIVGAKANATSDVYALGVMFYYLLTGVKPFHAADDMSVMYQHVNVNPTPIEELLPSPHDVPPEMIELIRRCMSKKPKERPIDANETLARLTEFASLPSFIERHSKMTPAPYRHTPLGVIQMDEPGPEDPTRRSINTSIGDSEFELKKTKASPVVYITMTLVTVAVLLAAIALYIAVTSENTKQPVVENPEVKEVPKELPKEVAAEPKSVLRLIASPTASVKLDGKDVGNTPLRLEMSPGPHVIAMSAKGHRKHGEKIELLDKKEHTVSVMLVGNKSKKTAQPIRNITVKDLR